jgi:hypothetical protein
MRNRTICQIGLSLLFFLFFVSCMLADRMSVNPFLTATSPAAGAGSTQTPVLLTGTPCTYIANIHPFPELASRFMADLDTAGIDVKEVIAEGDGEDCLNYLTNEFQYFRIRRTNFYVTLLTPSLSDTAELGNALSTMIGILAGYSFQEIPENNDGIITITFVSGVESATIRFNYNQALETHRQGLNGAALYNWLSRP